MNKTVFIKSGQKLHHAERSSRTTKYSSKEMHKTIITRVCPFHKAFPHRHLTARRQLPTTPTPTLHSPSLLFPSLPLYQFTFRTQITNNNNNNSNMKKKKNSHLTYFELKKVNRGERSTVIYNLWQSGETQSAMNKFFEKPISSIAPFLMTRPENKLEDALKIFYAVKASCGVTIPMVLTLMKLYKKQKMFLEAKELCDDLLHLYQQELMARKPKVAQKEWNTMIQELAKNSREEAVKVLNDMIERGFNPTTMTTDAVNKYLTKNANQSQATPPITNPAEMDQTVHKNLFTIFTNEPKNNEHAENEKSTHVERILRSIPPKLRDVEQWNTLMKIQKRSENHREMLNLFDEMKREGVKINSNSVVLALHACAKLSDLEKGQEVAMDIDSDMMESSKLKKALLFMFSECGDVKSALALFHKMETDDVDVWNAMISILACCGRRTQAVSMFLHMQRKGITPNNTSEAIVSPLVPAWFLRPE